MPNQRSVEGIKRRRDQKAAVMRDRSRQARDIGPIPAVVNPERRARGENDLEFFLRTYYPETFYLAWSSDHRRAIALLETVVKVGGQFAFAMPRGSGKTGLARCAVEWAILYGKREFTLFIGSDEGSACEQLDAIKSDIEHNDLLLEDFPEVCFPIRALEGISHRCPGQTLDGERTHIGWTAKELTLPTVKGSKASAATVRVAGITGRIRGMNFARPDGRKVRPDLVIIDDPQTEESANSPKQCDDRERTLSGAILGLAGPGKKIAAVMNCTVIRPGDVADRMLSREKHPEWQGERTKMLRAFPANMALWENYYQIRADALRAGNGVDPANAFYDANREAMDAGADAAWAQRHNTDERSAVQHAMNLYFADQESFAAEYQNEPIVKQIGDSEQANADQILAKSLPNLASGTVPVGATHLTAYADVQGKLLYWMVCAWGPGFTGWIIDYGTYPDQQNRGAAFTAQAARHTLARKFPGKGFEGQLFAGMEGLSAELVARDWKTQAGGVMRPQRMLIDANWGKSTDTVKMFCRQSVHAGIVMPAHGRFVGASSVPFDQFKAQPGERVGRGWIVRAATKAQAVRHIVIDTNFYKSFINARLLTSMGDAGCLSICGDKSQHAFLVEQLTSEYAIRTQGRGRTVDEWKIRPDRTENHWLDCLVGCAAAASELGVLLDDRERPVRRVVSLKELQAKRKKWGPNQRG